MKSGVAVRTLVLSHESKKKKLTLKFDTRLTTRQLQQGEGRRLHWRTGAWGGWTLSVKRPQALQIKGLQRKGPSQAQQATHISDIPFLLGQWP